MLTDIDNNSKKISEVFKIHFNIKKEVDFGKAIYIVGDYITIGLWDLQSSLRLNWNIGHEWCGTIIVDKAKQSKIQFKYVVADFQNPNPLQCEWEEGCQNRILSLENQRNSIICNHRWNLEKISFLLFVEQTEINNEYYIIGNVAELGFWKNKKQMKYAHVRDMSPLKSEQGKQTYKNIGQNAFDFTFYVNRSQKNIQYYYIKKGNQLEKQRNPKRTIDLTNLRANRHPECFSIAHHSADIQIYETCQFNQLHFSQITESISVGAYLRTKEDFEKLREHNITAVLSIQSKEDYNSHCLSTHYLKLLCQEHGIRYHAYSIKDNNTEDFIDKGMGAFLLLRKLISEDGLKVYVHCSAGMYRSPQVIVLYLVLGEQYALDEAIKTVTERHPFAKPNYRVLAQAINEIVQKAPQLKQKWK